MCGGEGGVATCFVDVMKLKLNLRIFARLYNVHHDGRLERLSSDDERCFRRLMCDVQEAYLIERPSHVAGGV